MHSVDVPDGVMKHDGNALSHAWEINNVKKVWQRLLFRLVQILRLCMQQHPLTPSLTLFGVCVYVCVCVLSWQNKWYTLYAKTAEEKQAWLQAFERESQLGDPLGPNTHTARVCVAACEMSGCCAWRKRKRCTRLKDMLSHTLWRTHSHLCLSVRDVVQITRNPASGFGFDLQETVEGKTRKTVIASISDSKLCTGLQVGDTLLQLCGECNDSLRRETCTFVSQCSKARKSTTVNYRH